MKNKSKLLLLPASLLLLTGCGASANTSIPRGYTNVDKADPAARQAFFNKVGEDIALTYAKAAEGFSMEGSFEIKEFYFKPNANDYYKLTDVKADYSFALVGLNENTKNAKAMLKVENVGFKLNFADNGKEYSLKASDLDIAAYYTDSTLYYDLSDKDVKTFVNDAIDLDYAMNGGNRSRTATEDKEKAAKYLGKYYIKDDDVEDVADAIPSALDAKTKAEIKETVSSVFEGLLSEEKVNNLLTLAEDKNSQGAAIALALTSEPVKVDSVSINGDLAASIVFNKEGLFTRFGFAGNVDVKSTDSSNPAQIKLSKLDLGASFKYGTNSVKLPSFGDYKEFQNN